MLFSWILLGLFILSPSTFVSAGTDERSDTYLYQLECKVNASFNSQIHTSAFFNTSILIRPISSSKASSVDLHNKYYVAIPDLSVNYLDGNSKVTLDDCESFEATANEMLTPFLASFENGLLKSIEVDKNESRLSANLKMEILYRFNLNIDMVHIQSNGVTNLIGMDAENSEFGDYDVLYNVQRQDVSNGYDIHVLKSFNSSFGKPVQPVSWNCDDNCNSDSHKELTWAIQQSVHIANRDNITVGPTIFEHLLAKYKPWKDSVDKFTYEKHIFIYPVAVMSTSIAPDFSNGSRQLLRQEAGSCEASSASTTNEEYPNLSKVTEALSCGSSAFDASYNIYKLPLIC